jgi:hypothetical protein
VETYHSGTIHSYPNALPGGGEKGTSQASSPARLNGDPTPVSGS